MTEPTSRFYTSHGLHLHYADWGNAGAPPLLLVHGGLDHCRSMDGLALKLRDRFHIVAPDLRGHGDSAWAPGSSYPMMDWVYDIHVLVKQLNWSDITIVAHSMGGMITFCYSGTFPEKIKRIINIEGVASVMTKPNLPMAKRVTTWFDQLDKFATWQPRRYATFDEAVAAMKSGNERLTDAQARHLTLHGAQKNKDGSYSWKFDNYQRTRAPYAPALDEYKELMGRITCPILHIQGGKSHAPDKDDKNTPSYFKDVRIKLFPDAGHWVHHEKLDAVMAEVDAFIAQT
jgi:pimeloyl-ACP methyl ester carboxylesterase